MIKLFLLLLKFSELLINLKGSIQSIVIVLILIWYSSVYDRVKLMFAGSWKELED